MLSSHDSLLGQLALARGLVSLSDLLRCAQQVGQSGCDLPAALEESGLVSSAELAALRTRLSTHDDASLQAELERGKTLLLQGLSTSGVDEHASESLQVGRTFDGGLSEVSEATALSRLDLSLAHEERYELREELGRGGMGQVVLARDRILQRDVALKALLPDSTDPRGHARLLLEARVTGLLEHPNITPVYDLRSSRDGSPFYTMRVVQEQSLEDVLDTLRAGADAALSLSNLISILRQVSLAIEYAHDRGVIHRDLKPENILIGEYGEVYVIDWGIAKIVTSRLGLDTGEQALSGSVVGTPRYMAPEQARGDNDKVDERTDVYALGAILYEILTLEPVFEAPRILALLFQVVHKEPTPPSERAPTRGIPAELEEICLRALAKDPAERYPSAQAFADELELFLEGVKERERRVRMAREAVEAAHHTRAVYHEVRERFGELRAELSRERLRVESWAGAEEKQELWDLEQQAEDMQVEIERRFGESVRSYGQALVHVPDMAEARQALAELYWQRFRDAETSGNRPEAAYFEGLVRQYNDGAYDALLEGNAQLSLVTEPAGAVATLLRFAPVNRRFAEWEVLELDPTPVNKLQVVHGSYVLRLEPEDHAPLRIPVLLDRGEAIRVEARLYPREEIPEDFVVIPGGPFLKGAAVHVAPERQVGYLDDFAIKRYPVTCGEYLEFLNDLNANDPVAASRYAPRVDDEAESYFPRDDEGRFVLPHEDAEGDRWSSDWPMILISYHDAAAYAQWRSQRDGHDYRLPTSEEWEKAARGVDGRLYPWGNHFDPSFCKMRESRRGKPTPEPVGSFAADHSPYGVGDLAGNVCEWTSSQGLGSDHTRILRGGSFNSVPFVCRLDFHMTSPMGFRHAHYGFRLVMPLASAPEH